jgi:hypothetical protein
MSSTKPIAIAISSANVAVASRSPASGAIAPTTSVASDTVGRVSFAMLQRWRGNNSPVLISHSIAAQQVRNQRAISHCPHVAGFKPEPALSGTCISAFGHERTMAPFLSRISLPKLAILIFRVERQVHAPYSKFLVSCHTDAAWAKLEAKEQGHLLQQLLIDEESCDAELVKRYDSSFFLVCGCGLRTAETSASSVAVEMISPSGIS